MEPSQEEKIYEELHDEFIRKLLTTRHRQKSGYDDYSDLATLCSGQNRRRDEEWREHYYYRCLSLFVAQAFIKALSECRNYITGVDVLTHFPRFQFYLIFRGICSALGGQYERGKCFHYLREEDWAYFLRLRREEPRPYALIRRWHEYLEKIQEERRRELPQLLHECRMRGSNGAPSATVES